MRSIKECALPVDVGRGSVQAGVHYMRVESNVSFEGGSNAPVRNGSDINHRNGYNNDRKGSDMYGVGP